MKKLIIVTSLIIAGICLMDSIAKQEIYSEYIRFSSGCPAISDNKMRSVDSLLRIEK